MEQNKPSIPEVLPPDTTPVTQQPTVIELLGWTEHEKELLRRAVDTGFKPISPTLSAQMAALFIQGYSCAEIAAQNKGFSEADVLYCRKKFEWDRERDEYTVNLTKRAVASLQRQKMESIEFLTNTMSVMHKQHREKMLKYLQTGNADDLPEFQITSMKMYKEVIETISKITGEDKAKAPASLTQINVNQGVTVNTQEPSRPAITQELQSKILRALAGSVQNKGKPQE